MELTWFGHLDLRAGPRREADGEHAMEGIRRPSVVLATLIYRGMWGSLDFQKHICLTAA